MEAPKTYGTVKLTKVKAAIAQIEEHYQECPERLEDVELTFEYLVGSFFPKIVNNITEQMNRKYSEGYFQGLQDGKERYGNQGNN